MSLLFLPDGWRQYGDGRRWRCASPQYRCEVDDEGVVPNLLETPRLVSAVRRIKSFYAGRIKLGPLDLHGAGLDILVANAMAESAGAVPSPLSTSDLRGVLDRASHGDRGAALDAVVRYVSAHDRMLERREPGYVNPVATPSRVSLGAHQVLVSTALGMMPRPSNSDPSDAIGDVVCRVPAESLFAAQLAVTYFNRARGLHNDELPLMAATYNAGSPRPDSSNRWNLRQYGNHVDRWIAYYNTSRMA
jgi:hypothetical protein